MKNNEMKGYHVTVKGQEVFFYKTLSSGEASTEHHFMHALAKTQIELKEPLEVGGVTYYLIKVSLSKSKARKCYFKDEVSCSHLFEALKKGAMYRSIHELYDMDKRTPLGQGKFGEVRLGVSKKTHQKVAIKVISKSKMSSRELEL
jgi:hypothetical protein